MHDSLFEQYKSQRTEAFQVNRKLDKLINELKILLEPVQKTVNDKYYENKWPVGLIIGNPRSGTTLLLQWLSGLGCFSYPSNLLNRFSYAPYIGVSIQKILFDKRYDFQGEFSDIQSEINYSSNIGKSKGALAPSEFQHFFRHFMPNFDPEFLEEKKLKEVDFIGIKKSLASIEAAFNKPFVTKAIMLQYNLKELFQAMPRILFIYIKRDPLYNMQSVLKARENYYGDPNLWWSVKPKEYEILKEKNIYQQIAGQVFYTNQAIKKQLETIPEEKRLSITYEQLCKDPSHIYRKIRDKFHIAGYSLPAGYRGPESFELRNNIKIDQKEFNKLGATYQELETQNSRS